VKTHIFNAYFHPTCDCAFLRAQVQMLIQKVFKSTPKVFASTDHNIDEGRKTAYISINNSGIDVGDLMFLEMRKILILPKSD